MNILIFKRPFGINPISGKIELGLIQDQILKEIDLKQKYYQELIN